MKRARDWDASRGGYQGSGKLLKRQKRYPAVGPSSRGAGSGFSDGGGGPGVWTVPTQVVRRTVGPVAAENHYFDAERADTAIQVITTTWADTEADATTGSTPTAINCLFAPIQGDDISNRQGRKVFVKKIRINGVICTPVQALQDTADVPPEVRLILFCDTQTNFTQAQGEEVIASGRATLPLHQYQNLANLGRYQIYKDKTFILNNPALTNNSAANNIVQNSLRRGFKWTIKVNKWVTYKDSNNGTVADVVDNSFHLLAGTNGAATVPTLLYKVRTVFVP